MKGGLNVILSFADDAKGKFEIFTTVIIYFGVGREESNQFLVRGRRENCQIWRNGLERKQEKGKKKSNTHGGLGKIGRHV